MNTRHVSDRVHDQEERQYGGGEFHGDLQLPGRHVFRIGENGTVQRCAQSIANPPPMSIAIPTCLWPIHRR